MSIVFAFLCSTCRKALAWSDDFDHRSLGDAPL
jgi:hypothetical protein